jgi:hypothetical protein
LVSDTLGVGVPSVAAMVLPRGALPPAWTPPAAINNASRAADENLFIAAPP